jgi:hypothetical protein
MNGIDAGRLLGYALNPTLTPGSGGKAADYGRLVERYLGDETFRMLFDDILEGVGCTVAHASLETGIVVLAEPESPWCWPARSSDLPWHNKQHKEEDQRAARMLVIPALLAYIAPTAADLEDFLTDPTLQLREVPVADLENFIREAALHLERANGNPDGEERPLWWYWVQRAQDKSAGPRSTSTYLVADVLGFLHEHQLMVRCDSKQLHETTFRPRRRLLAHYRDLMVDELFRDLQDLAAGYERQSTARLDESEN